ncbi:cytochrome d ubiquinol oxidase subunit II [Actinoallomurus rhizosphaericola]|uniref:cytochrome d ubiquinol oxidase subunit II n=1 Tax=Actinoallomurus rhizosphaericola TaxID=2952536 RepID=UPI002092A642|nr:cytochrome d ubiquinol oxidase subunit II [Actinoallomurus rhizosphaericola]MCO5998104.1 cytochrome d ubiquinol oxidase subunit II [Actinoallomurus rhizosphaericola]
MTAAQAVLALAWAGVMMYALLGGADFGGGFWDTLAGSPRRGYGQRRLIEHAIGPVWEANHVWLIFVLVIFWTCFPIVFASVASTMYIPLTLVAFGIIARGAAFAFRKASTELWQLRLFGGAFALSSVVTPFFLGAIAGGVASGRVPAGLAKGDIVGSWVNPTSFLGGVLAIGTTAYLAAVYLTADARREGRRDLAEAFRHRGIIAAVVTGVIVIGGIFVIRQDAPRLYSGLIGRALPIVVLSAVAGIVSLALLAARRYALARVTAALAVAAVIWGWPVAQYPLLLPPHVTVMNAAAQATVLRTTLASVLIGLVLLVPSLVWLFTLFQRSRHAEPD